MVVVLSCSGLTTDSCIKGSVVTGAENGDSLTLDSVATGSVTGISSAKGGFGIALAITGSCSISVLSVGIASFGIGIIGSIILSAAIGIAAALVAMTLSLALNTSSIIVCLTTGWCSADGT